MSAEPGGYFAVIPARILHDRELSSTAKLLYGEISAKCNELGYCYASNGALAALMGCGERTVSRLIGELETRGEIVIETLPTKDRRGHWERRLYTRETAAGIGRSYEDGVDKNGDPDGGVDKNGEAGVDKNGEAYIGLNNKVTNNPPISPQGESEQIFERFWAKYPKKKGKEAARRAWRKLKPSLALCRVMSAALERDARGADWQRDGGRYIPYPATWLNGRRWEDEEQVAGVSAGSPPPKRRYRGTRIVDGEEVDVFE